MAALGASSLAAQESGEPEPIADNSFLIEEAYNQEAGVVQHINTFVRPDGGGAWAYSFTQEWPLRGMRNQLSYTRAGVARCHHRHWPRRHPAQLPLQLWAMGATASTWPPAPA